MAIRHYYFHKYLNALETPLKLILVYGLNTLNGNQSRIRLRASLPETLQSKTWTDRSCRLQIISK